MKFLVFEPFAHRTAGHYPLRFAEIIDSLLTTGNDCCGLTPLGWSGNAEVIGARHPIECFEMPAFLRWFVCSKIGSGLGHRFHSLVVGIWLAWLVRKFAQAQPVVLVSMAYDYSVHQVASMLPDGLRILWITGRECEDGKWNLLCQKIHRMTKSKQIITVLLTSENLMKQWGRHSGIDLALFRYALPFCPPTGGVEIPELRGLPKSRKCALFFGGPDVHKDPETVWRAANLLAQHLTVIGAGARMRESIDSFKSNNPDIPLGNIFVIDRYLTESEKISLFKRSDLCICSFSRDNQMDSGSVLDAVAWGIPSLVSSPGWSADFIKEYGVGDTFDRGDFVDLASKAIAMAELGTERFFRPIDEVRKIYSRETMAMYILDLVN